MSKRLFLRVIGMSSRKDMMLYSVAAGLLYGVGLVRRLLQLPYWLLCSCFSVQHHRTFHSIKMMTGLFSRIHHYQEHRSSQGEKVVI